MDGEGLAPDGGLGEAALLIGVELKWDLPGWQVDLLAVFGRPELAETFGSSCRGAARSRGAGRFRAARPPALGSGGAPPRFAAKCRGFLQEIV